jgi:Flp pilus assembly protein TadD
MSKKRKHRVASAPPDRAWLMPALAGAALVLLTVLSYIPALRAGFIWDDPDYVINNHTLRDLGGLWEMWTDVRSLPQWYPLTHTSFWIEYQLWGAGSAAGYHVTNVLLHAANAAFLWRVLARLRVPGAWLASAVFAVHPVCVESVAWVTERKNVLSLLFYLLALRAYLTTAVIPSAYFVALGLFIAALLSKSVTATLPAAILVLLWWKQGRVRVADVLPLVPFFMLGITSASLTGWLETHHVGARSDQIIELNLSPVQRVLIAGRAIWFYAGKLLLPVDLAFIYPRWSSIEQIRPWLWLFPLALLTTIASLFQLRGRIGRGPLAAVLLFCGTLTPALSFVNVYPMRFSFVADHFQYHASIWFIALVIALVWRLAALPRWVVVPMLVIPVSVACFLRARVFVDAEALWRDTLAKNDTSWMVRTNLAHVLRERGDDRSLDEAERHYLEALWLAPYLHDTHTNAGMVFGRRGEYDRAIERFNEALRINPEFAPAFYGWGQVLERRGDIEGALAKYRKALELKPFYPEANFRHARILESRGDFGAAIDHYRTAVTYNDAYVEARYNLANLLIRFGHFDEAIWNLSEAVKFKPDYLEAWTNLGAAQLRSGRPNEAEQAYLRALEINPNFALARDGLLKARATRR